MNTVRARGGSTLTNISPNTFVLCGGANRLQEHFGDFYLVSATPSQELMESGGSGILNIQGVLLKDMSISERSDHTAILYDGGVYIFGGQIMNKNLHYDDMHVLQISKSHLPMFHNVIIDSLQLKEIDYILHNEAHPCGRNGHSMTLDQQAARFLLFGGADDTGPKNDLWAYYPETEKWQIITPKNTAPTPRYMHSAHLIYTPSPTLLVFGGIDPNVGCLDEIYSFNLESQEWNNIGRMPVKAAAMASAAHGEYIYIYGGSDWNKFFATLIRYNTCTRIWELFIDKNNLPIFIEGRIGACLAFSMGVKREGEGETQDICEGGGEGGDIGIDIGIKEDTNMNMNSKEIWNTEETKAEEDMGAGTISTSTPEGKIKDVEGEGYLVVYGGCSMKEEHTDACFISMSLLFNLDSFVKVQSIQ